MAPSFTTPPPTCEHALLSFPTPSVLLVTLNRPKALNCINTKGHHELDAVWNWLDNEPSLNIGIVTGTGRAFCAGADLKGTYTHPHEPPNPQTPTGTLLSKHAQYPPHHVHHEQSH